MHTQCKKKTTDNKKLPLSTMNQTTEKNFNKDHQTHKIPLQLRYMPKNAISVHKQVKKLLLTSSFLLIKSEKYRD